MDRKFIVFITVPRGNRLLVVLTAATLVALSACSESNPSSATTEPPAGASVPAVVAGVATYKAYVGDQIDLMIADTQVFTDAIRAGDLKAAQAAYATSRVGWERIEPIAGLIETFDGVVDSRVDDFESVNDPNFTGWHRLEYLLFSEGTLSGAVPFANQLQEDLAELEDGFAELEIPAASVPVGASELVEEVSLGKITGEENRYAKTDLWDIEANLVGSVAAIDALAPALKATDPELLSSIRASFAEVFATIKPLRQGDGWKLYCIPNDKFPSDRCPAPTLTQSQVTTLQAQLAALSEQTSQVAGALDLA
jgi:iron uptake system component EfeO